MFRNFLVVALRNLFRNRLYSITNVLGLSIGIVQNDSVIYSKGFGTRELGEDLPVDENTIFGIGSISKSFTALTLGFLVDEGKINWDDKVIDYLPYFEMYDPYVTQNFTIRDLLTHRSGLNRQSKEILWLHSNLTRNEILKHIKHLKPGSGFREKAIYNNAMYMVAGEIVREVSGVSWDEFLQKRVFDRLGMINSTSVSEIRDLSGNLAQPHTMNSELKLVSYKRIKGELDITASAGGI